MCSFITSNRKFKDLVKINWYTGRRGPDGTNVFEQNGITFLHNLLSITGDFSEQPFVEDDIVCVYNGEIYNYRDFGDYKSDGHALIPMYRQYGEKFLEKLDGEFAILLIDFKNDILLMSSDTFATKPLWYSIEDGDFGIATYESALRDLGFDVRNKLEANTYLKFKLSTLQAIAEGRITHFDLKQHKDHYSDWMNSYLLSIEKRAGNARESVFIGLSSGYDSGAIACALNLLKLPYKAYVIPGAEDIDVINQRNHLVDDMIILDITPQEFFGEKDYLMNYCENFPSARTDKASAGLSHICRHGVRDGYKIYLSGQGADEILSDYGHNGRRIYNHSQFGGRFPDNLESLFPWRSFYGGTQKKYLGKEECVAGSHGVETRYPFLDKSLVQEFLWLTPELKNAHYKAPLHEFLTRNNFPFAKNKKVGFRPNHKFKQGER